jgi:hypothetical protein
VRWCGAAVVTSSRPRAVGGVGGGGTKVDEEENICWRRNPTMKTMKRKPTHERKKLTTDRGEEEAGGYTFPG